MSSQPSELPAEDADYFQSRAEAEVELAQKAEHPGAVRAHYLLASHYLDRVYGGESGAEGEPAPPA